MWKKLFLTFFLVLVAAFVAAFFYLPQFAEKKLNQVFEKADSASFSHLEINFWDGNIQVDNFYINDTSGGMLKIPLQGKLKTLKIRHVDVYKLLTTKRIYADSIYLGPGNLGLILPEKDATKSAKKNSKKPPLKSFLIGHIHLDSLHVAVQFHPTDTGSRISAQLHFEATKLGAPFHNLSDFDTEAFNLQLDTLYAQNNDGITVYNVDYLAFNTAKKQLALHKIKIRQRKKRILYERHFGYDKLHFEVDVDSLILSDLPPIHSLINKLHVPQIDIYKPLANLYKDRRFYHKPHTRKFPFEAVSELPFPLRVDSIVVHHGTLYFEENSREDGRTAKLDLQDVAAKISNIDSDGPNELGDWTTVVGDVKFYNQLPFTFLWKFDLRQKGKTFLFDGTFGQSSLALFNPFLINKTDVIFQKGKFLGGRILVEGNKNNGEGTLHFYYADMRLKWLNKNDHESNFGRTIVGSAANLFIKNNNLPDKKPRLGIIYAEPEKDRFIISFLWKLMQAGLVDIILTSNNSQKAEARKNQYLN